MGVLDDAIREHLDLKRRRGADPSEVERAEREALGPVRREPEEVAVDEAPVEDIREAVEDELAYADGETEWDDSWQPEPEAAPEPEPEPPAVPAEPPRARAEPAAAPRPVPAPSEERVERAPRPRDPEEPLQHGEETAEYDVPGELEKEQHKDAEDVLEETPDFLQDTPDHDRLWFEQKPPRDFDFDG